MTNIWNIAESGDEEALEKLLKGIERPKLLEEKRGTTALMTAVNCDFTETAIMLIKLGAAYHFTDRFGRTALSMAPPVMKTRLEACIKERGTMETTKFTSMLDIAQRTLDVARTGEGLKIETLLCGATKAALQYQKTSSSNQSELLGTALMLASSRGDKIMVNALVQAGSDVNAQSSNFGWTALMIAANSGNRDIVVILAADRANVDLQDKRGYTALMMAAMSGKDDVVKSLLKLGADRSLKNKAGKTAADLAETEDIRNCIQNYKAEKVDSAQTRPAAPTQAGTSSAAASGKTTTAAAAAPTAAPSVAQPASVPTATGEKSPQKSSNASMQSGNTGSVVSQPNAVSALLKVALQRGSKAWLRSKFSLLGQGRAGKTAFANAVAGRVFEETASTVGINQLTCDVKHIKTGTVTVGSVQEWRECKRGVREYEGALAGIVAQQQRSEKGISSPTSTTGDDIRAYMQSVSKPAVSRAPQVTGNAPVVSVATGTPSKQAAPSASGAASAQVTSSSRIQPVLPTSIPATKSPAPTARTLVPAVASSAAVDALGNLLISPSPNGNALAAVPVTPSVVDEETVMKELAKLQDADSGLLISLFDFGGQAVFDVIHHLFLTRNGVYALMFNMEWLVSDGPDKVTALSFVRKWLSSITAHTLREGRTAPIVIVGTRLDKVGDPAVHQRISNVLYEELHDSLAWPSVIKNDSGKDSNGRAEQVFFPVDNKLGKKGFTMKHVMSVVTAAMDKAEYTHKEVPLTWFKAIDQMSDTKRDCLLLSEVVSILSGCSVSEEEVPLLLSFLHDMGHLMWLDEPGLRDVVILDPVSYLVTPATIIVCKLEPDKVDHTYHHMEVHAECQVKHRWEFDSLVSRGILSVKLLPILWKQYEQHTATLLQLMVKFGLLVPLRGGAAAGTPSQYLVPSLLSLAPLADPELVNWTDKPTSLCYFVFTLVEQLEQTNTLTAADLSKSGFLPGGMFERIVGKALSWCQDTARGSTITIDSVVLHKDLAILSFGQQRFRLVHCADIHCVRVDVEGRNPVGIQQKLLDFIRCIVLECMGSLFCFPAVLFETGSVDPPRTISKCVKESDMLIPLERLRSAVTGGSMLTRRGGRTLLTVEEVKAKYGQWLQLHELRERYDAFISYRWGEHDSKFTEQLFDMLTNYSVGAQSRAVEVFLDKKRLQEGRLFKFDFAAALTHSLVALPTVSVDALQRMLKHDPQSVDNVLLEWVMVLESHRAGRLLKVYPVLFGVHSSSALGGEENKRVSDFFAHNAKDQLPKVAPTATLAQAAELLQANGIQPSKKMQSYTVHSVVQELLQFLLCKASDFPSSMLVETYAEKVVHLLGDCGGAVLDSVVANASAAKTVTAMQANNPVSPTASHAHPASAGGKPSGALAALIVCNTSATFSGKRALKDLTVAEVGELMVRCELEDLQPIFAANKVKGRRLANCDTYEDLMEDSVGVKSKVVAKELLDLIAEWKADGVPDQ